MKKSFVLVLALAMSLTGASALAAETVTIGAPCMACSVKSSVSPSEELRYTCASKLPSVASARRPATSRREMD